MTVFQFLWFCLFVCFCQHDIVSGHIPSHLTVKGHRQAIIKTIKFELEKEAFKEGCKCE